MSGTILKNHKSEHIIYDNNMNVIYQSDPVAQHGYIVKSTLNGKGLITSREVFPNKLTVQGRNYLLEKAFEMRSSFNPSSLDVDLGMCLPTDIDRSIDKLKVEKYMGFIIGNGGYINDSRLPVEPHKKNVASQIPFRIVPATEDLTGAERAKYLLRVPVEDNIWYYGKKISNKVIKNLYTNGVEIPNDVDLVENPGIIKSYTELGLSIDVLDGREYYLLTEGSTANARFNSIGLFTGYEITLPSGDIECRYCRVNTIANTSDNDLQHELNSTSYYYQYLLY